VKYLITVLCAVALLVGCVKVDRFMTVKVDYARLQDRSGVMYLPNEEKPFKGVAVLKFKKEWWRFWHTNGQKEYEGTYKDGKQYGLFTELPC